MKSGIILLILSAVPMLALGSPSVATPQPSSPATVSALPSPSSQVADALAEIEAGKIFLKECQFDDAKAAFIRALKSTDPRIREKALRGLRKTLEMRDAPSWRNWIVEPAKTSFANLIRTIASGGVILLVLGMVWLSIGQIGIHEGFGSVRVEDMQGEETDGARVFRLSVVAALEYFRSLEMTGAIGPGVVAPFLSPESFPNRDGGLLETEGVPGGKILGKFIGRFRIPQYRIRVMMDDDFIVIELQEGKASLKRWCETIPRDTAFINENRLAREVVYYLIATHVIATRDQRP